MNLKKGDNFEVMWVCIVFAFIFRKQVSRNIDTKSM